MFGGSGRNGFAIGLGVGICLTVVFFMWVLGASQPVKTASYAENYTQETQEHTDQDLFGWWEHDGVLITSKDSLAQWTMAILGVVATAASVWAVLLIKSTLQVGRQTLVATQDMADDTSEIGRKQVRANIAYFGYEVIDTSHMSGGADTGLVLVFKNFGQSPAKEVTFDVMNDDELIWSGIVNEAGDQPPPEFRNFSYDRVRGKTLLFCGPGAEVRSHICRFNKQEIIERRSVRPRQFRYIAGWIRYKDDFWQTDNDYRFCKFCIIVDSMVRPEILLASLPAKDTIKLREHGPNNYSE